MATKSIWVPRPVEIEVLRLPGGTLITLGDMSFDYAYARYTPRFQLYSEGVVERLPKNRFFVGNNATQALLVIESPEADAPNIEVNLLSLRDELLDR
jgi:hypothetical protein